MWFNLAIQTLGRNERKTHAICLSKTRSLFSEMWVLRKTLLQTGVLCSHAHWSHTQYPITRDRLTRGNFAPLLCNVHVPWKPSGWSPEAQGSCVFISFGRTDTSYQCEWTEGNDLMKKTKGRTKPVYQSLPVVCTAFLLAGSRTRSSQNEDVLSDQVGKRVSLWPPLTQKGKRKWLWWMQLQLSISGERMRRRWERLPLCDSQ